LFCLIWFASNHR
jgi:hypothetical protein